MRKSHALLGCEVVIIFEVVAFEARIAVDGLAGADEAEARIAKAHAIMAVPAMQHGFVDFPWHGADRRALPDPARRRIAHPRLAVAFGHVFGLHAAERV